MKTPAEQLAQATKGMETVEASQIDRMVANGVELTATISMAISLKRIADAMTTGTKNDRVPATTVAQAFGYKPGMANHDLLIAHIERMAEHGFMVVES